jgi:hypothetical protein
MVKRVRSLQTRSSKAQCKTAARALLGEVRATYEELFARVHAAVEPVDIIDEMFVAEIVCLEWDVLPYRRLKVNQIQAEVSKPLKDVLAEQLDYDLYSEDFAERLAAILQENFPKDQTEAARTLASECAGNDPDAIEKVDRVLSDLRLDAHKILDDVRAQKAKELVQAYFRREPDAVKLIDELLAGAGHSVHAFMAHAVAANIDLIERIERLTSIAESRRNDSLHEIDRRRAILGEMLRQTVQEIEESEPQMIEATPDERKTAA